MDYDNYVHNLSNSIRLSANNSGIFDESIIQEMIAEVLLSGDNIYNNNSENYNNEEYDENDDDSNDESNSENNNDENILNIVDRNLSEDEILRARIEIYDFYNYVYNIPNMNLNMLNEPDFIDIGINNPANTEPNTALDVNTNNIVRRTINLQNGQSIELVGLRIPVNNHNTYFNEKVNVVLSDKSLDKLKQISYAEVQDKITTDDKCTICLTELSVDSNDFKYIILPCSHVYHADCITEYLKSYDYHCPLCRKEVGESISKI